MKYYLIIISLLVLTSCGGTRKTNASRLELKSTALSVNNDIELKQNSTLLDIISLQPLDNTQPIIINGISYYNASIRFDKSKFDNLEIKANDNLSQDSIDKVEKVKVTERKDYTLLWAGIAFVIALFIFLYIYLPKLK